MAAATYLSGLGSSLQGPPHQFHLGGFVLPPDCRRVSRSEWQAKNSSGSWNRASSFSSGRSEAQDSFCGSDEAQAASLLTFCSGFVVPRHVARRRRDEPPR